MYYDPLSVQAKSNLAKAVNLAINRTDYLVDGSDQVG